MDKKECLNKKLRFGIVLLDFSEKWLGGLYYIQNLLMSLDTLSEEQKPVIDLYYTDDIVFENLKSQVSYPYIVGLKSSFIPYKFFIFRVLRKLCLSWSFNVDYLKFRNDDLFIYPYFQGTKYKKVFWKPDFQERHLTHLFDAKELYRRKKILDHCLQENIPIVFSSKDSYNDFKKFYPSNNVKTFVVHFAVFHPNISSVNINNVKNKYKIEGDYLICPNQFWMHKNHKTLFAAFRKAVSMGLNKTLICTGYMNDKRNPEYIKEILSYITNNNLSGIIRILGVIDRRDLLCLIKYAYAVVQPSLFEGWNSTVEDCKCLNKFIFLSDLPVNREQICDNVCFFNPRDIDDIADKLVNTKVEVHNCDYTLNQEEFGSSFMEVVKYMSHTTL